eukprot:1277557-Amphidinium_carterae.1
MPERLRRKLTGIVKENMDAFSDNQQRYLLSVDSPLLTSDRDREATHAAAYQCDRYNQSDDSTKPQHLCAFVHWHDCNESMLLHLCKLPMREPRKTFKEPFPAIAETTLEKDTCTLGYWIRCRLMMLLPVMTKP